MSDRLARLATAASTMMAVACLATGLVAQTAGAQEIKIIKTDTQIDALDPGIRLFVREKMQEGNTRFTNENVVLFLHGATGPSTCDFDLGYKDYSWADWLVKHGYVVWMGDYRNYGGSTREKAMDEPAANTQPLTRSYQALRDIEAMVNHIKRSRGVQKVTLIGWSWAPCWPVTMRRCTARTCTSWCFTRRSIVSTTTPTSAPAARCKTSASRTSSTSRWEHIGSPRKRRTRDGGTARSRSRTRTNTGTLPCRPPSGPNAWRPIPRATRETLRACVLPTACWRTRSIRPPAGRCGTPRASTFPP